MLLGLGTGSTFEVFLGLLEKKIKAGLHVRGIPSSRRTEELAARAGVEIADEVRSGIDLDIDGTDEFDDRLFLIKGGGGALFREKIIASSSRKIIIIADSSKYNPIGIGRFPVPVEITPFHPELTIARFRSIGIDCVLRGSGNYVTDSGNLIADCSMGTIEDPVAMESALKAIPGVIEVGIFTGMDPVIYMGQGESVKVFQK